MPHFVILQRLRPAGRKSMRESPARIKQNIQQLGIAGSASQLVFLTLGAHDIVALAELPDDEAALKLVAQRAVQGHAESTVPRAFTLDEAERAMNG